MTKPAGALSNSEQVSSELRYGAIPAAGLKTALKLGFLRFS
jgi:hypothetical protein